MSSPGRGWMQTFTGRQFYPLAPRAEDIAIEDVAHGLAMTCRYGGHTKHFYSVAEHCVLVSRHVPPEFAREGLLHDTAEAYIGDMVRPLKYQDAMLEFRKAEAAIERCVAERFALRTDPEALAAVKEIDDRILVDEISALMPRPELYLNPGGDGKGGTLGKLAPLGAEILGYTPERAEVLFLLRFYELFPEHRPPGFTGDLEIL